MFFFYKNNVNILSSPFGAPAGVPLFFISSAINFTLFYFRILFDKQDQYIFLKVFGFLGLTIRITTLTASPRGGLEIIKKSSGFFNSSQGQFKIPLGF